jgi:hypothetical protein
MASKKTLSLNGIEVRVVDGPTGEFLCLTDLAKVIGDKTGKVIGELSSTEVSGLFELHLPRKKKTEAYQLQVHLCLLWICILMFQVQELS